MRPRRRTVTGARWRRPNRRPSPLRTAQAKATTAARPDTLSGPWTDEAPLTQPGASLVRPGASSSRGNQLVENAWVDVTPRRRHIRHQRNRVRRADQIEAMPAQHRRVTQVVPMLMRATLAVPTITRRRLAVQIAQPTDRTRVEATIHEAALANRDTSTGNPSSKMIAIGATPVQRASKKLANAAPPIHTENQRQAPAPPAKPSRTTAQSPPPTRSHPDGHDPPR